MIGSPLPPTPSSEGAQMFTPPPLREGVAGMDR
jgi:hypothetical protein